MDVEIDVLQPDKTAFTVNRSAGRPNGVKVRPLGYGSQFGNPPDAWRFIVSIDDEDIAKDALREGSKEEIRKWLIAFFEKLKSKRIRINGREPNAEGDIDRIVSEEIHKPCPNPPP